MILFCFLQACGCNVRYLIFRLRTKTVDPNLFLPKSYNHAAASLLSMIYGINIESPGI